MSHYHYHVSLSRPIVVTFEEFKDRDEVLRKAGLVKGGQVHVTEDMSRKVSHHHHHHSVIKLYQVRESRQELRRFMRDARRSNPACVCRLALSNGIPNLHLCAIASLQYDTLYIDKKCYKYNPVEGRVVEHTVN